MRFSKKFEIMSETIITMGLDDLFIYNTLTGKKEKFEPLNPPFVTIYHCGITPYDYSHIGHLRAEVAVDLLRRTLRFLGYIDIAISNFTDIDDKIIRRAKEENVNWEEIPRKYIKYHLDVTRKINNLPFYVYPKVTEHINDIIEFVKLLIDKGYAYVGKTGIYFEVDRYPYYGQLSGRTDRTLWEQELDVLQDKKKPYDFALWKFRKPGEPFWNSPWGEGRPGWHIECSTMSTKYLGKQIDIHSGGADIIFPHHENEIAQSESALGVRPWVKYWFHVGIVKLRGEKMSKSLGNIIRAGDAIEEFGAMPLRFYLLSTHYRRPLDVTIESIEAKAKEYNRMTSLLSTLLTVFEGLEPSYSLSSDQQQIFNSIMQARKKFIDAILDDLNTSEANSIIHQIESICEKILKNPNYSTVLAAIEFFATVNQFYAIWDDLFKGKKGDLNLVYNLIELLMVVRQRLRESKYYELSDFIREKLKEYGIFVSDEGKKSTWKIQKI